MLIGKQESIGLNHFSYSRGFAKYLNDMDSIYRNIEEYNPDKNQKILIVFDHAMADMLSNKRLNPIVFIRGTKLDISLVFIGQTCFVVPEILD